MHFSVIIPVFNAERFLARAVQSALAQPETGQVVVVEDGSTDDSLRICRELARQFPQITLLQHPGGSNRGISASRNLGWRAARFPFVAFLDADDYYLERRFRAARRILQADRSIDGVYDAVGTAYEHDDARRWYRTLDRPELTTITEPVPAETLFETILAGRKGFFHTDGVVVSQRLLDRVDGFDVSLTVAEDTATWIKMAAVGRLTPGILTEPVSMRRVHAHNTMRRHEQHYQADRLRMARSLLQWAHQQKLPKKRVRLLLDLLLRFRLDTIDRSLPYGIRKSHELACLATFALQHPSAIRSDYYRHVVAYTVGGRRCKQILQRVWPRAPRRAPRCNHRSPADQEHTVPEPARSVS